MPVSKKAQVIELLKIARRCALEGNRLGALRYAARAYGLHAGAGLKNSAEVGRIEAVAHVHACGSFEDNSLLPQLETMISAAIDYELENV